MVNRNKGNSTCPPIDAMAWLPDETLYSLCSREHILSNRHLSCSTTNALFGHRRHGSQHDLPAHLDTFQRRTHGILSSSVRELCLEHTLLRFYLPWRSQECEARLLEAARLGHAGAIKHLLGLMSSRFGAEHPLKSCPSCCDEDRRRYGVAYWHLSHQFPGVWACQTHQSRLCAATFKTNGIGRFLWYLPENIALQPNEMPSPIHWRHFASLVCSATHHLANTHIDHARLHDCYCARLRSLGYGRGNFQISLARIAKDSLAAWQIIRQIPDMSSLPSSVEENMLFLQTTLRTHRFTCTPLRHFALIYWLFGDWQTFDNWYTHSYVISLSRQRSILAKERVGSSNARSRAIDLIVNLGRSAHSAAVEVGVQTETVIRWATADGLQLGRPLNAERIGLVQEILKGGRAVDIARSAGVPTQAVVRLIHSQVGLRQKWTEARTELLRSAHRRKWLEAQAEFAGQGITARRRMLMATYSWLYRNDRPWLTESMTSPARSSKPPFSERVNWHARDLMLADSIRFALEHPHKLPEVGLRQFHLVAQLPALRHHLSKLAKLPLTSKLLGQMRPATTSRKSTSL